MSVEKKILFTIDGFDVYENSQYATVDKKDGDAPTGYQNAGVSKLPSDGVDDSHHVRWVRLDNGEGVWDTGFYESSPCYKDMDEKEVKEIVKSVRKNILDKYRKDSSNPKAFETGEEHNSFFDRKKFKVKSGRMYNTASSYDLMDLYFSLRSFKICPQGKGGDAKYRNASFIVVDVTKKKTNKQEKLMQEASATNMFMTLLKTDRGRILSIMKWIDFPVTSNVDDPTLISFFMEYVRGTYDKAETLLKLFDESETDNGRAMFEIFAKIKDGISNPSSKLTRNKNGALFFDNIEVGSDIKGAARNIAYKEGLSKIKKEILLSDAD